MAGNIKGITIEFRGDTTKLSKAINDVRKDTRAFDKELGYIDQSLKFNPGNLDLVKQKMAVLEKAAAKSEENTKDLKKALEDMKNNGVDETSEDYRELEREIIKAESKQKDYNKELKNLKAAASPLGQAAKKMEDFGNKAVAAGEALAPISAAAGAVDIALAALAVKSGKAADDLNTLSKTTGIGTDKLQKYALASDLVDVSVEAIAKSQTKLKKSMKSAADGMDALTIAEDGTVTGGNAMAKAFDELGVSVTDSNGELRDQEDVFQDVIKALGSMKNETERDALAMQIFGKSATELNPLIEDSGETYKKVAQIFKKNGLDVVDQKTLDKANKFNDSLDTIKMTGTAALSAIGMKLAGYLAPALKKVEGFVSKLAGWLSKLSPQTLTIIGVIAGLVAGLAPLLIIIGKISLAISSMMTLWAKVGPLLSGLSMGPIGIAIAAIAALIAIGVLLYKNWDKIKEKLKKFKEWFVETWKKIKTKVKDIVQGIKDAIVDKFKAMRERAKEIISNLREGIVDRFRTMKDKVKDAVQNMRESVRDKLSALKDRAKAIVDGIKSSIVDKFQSAKEKVKGVFDSLKEAVSGKLSSLKEKVTTVFKLIKLAMTHPVELAKAAIKGLFDKIKSIFNTKLTFPRFKLPHFKVDGGKAPWGIGGAGRKPSFSIDWYKKGGIFTKPTLLGDGSIGVGEAGAEAVLPLNELWKHIDAINAGITINVYASPDMDVNRLATVIQQKLVLAQMQKAKAF